MRECRERKGKKAGGEDMAPMMAMSIGAMMRVWMP